MMLSSSPRASSTLSSAQANAVSTSPSAIAAIVRLSRFQASAWMFSSSRAPSTAPSKTSAASAIRPCNPERRAEHREDEREEVALAGGAADRQRAPGVAARRLEAVEVHLGRGQVDERVEAARQLVVGQGVDELGDLVAMRLRGRGVAAVRRSERRASRARRP